MAARQLRWILFCEFLGYLFWGNWLSSHAGWSPGEVAWFVAGFFFGGRLLFVLATFAISRPASDPVPPVLRVGPFGALRMVAGEYIALCGEDSGQGQGSGWLLDRRLRRRAGFLLEQSRARQAWLEAADLLE